MSSNDDNDDNDEHGDDIKWAMNEMRNWFAIETNDFDAASDKNYRQLNCNRICDRQFPFGFLFWEKLFIVVSLMVHIK